MNRRLAEALLTAARPKTLPAAVCPVVAGSALAWRLTQQFSWFLAVCTLLSTICIQVATNYFNDAEDAAKGADTPARLGPVRATAAGLVSRRTMLLAGLGAVLAAALFSIPLLSARGWPILAIGIVSLLCSYGYTGGPWPLAYRGLGDLFVLLFFGFVAVTGTVFVHSGTWLADALLLGLQIGSLSTALIAINNLRDIKEDTRSGKRTLAVRHGKKVARMMIGMWLLAPYVVSREWTWPARNQEINLVLLPCLALPLAIFILVKVLTTEPSAAYNKLLAWSAAHLLGWTLLFTVACLIP
jgi:1,4-dihydroxy-2-naphthoate polyprenyltransferase